MCDVGKAISRAVTPPGTGAREAAAEQAQAEAAAALHRATDEQAKALKMVRAATVPPEDNESAVAAADARLRRMIAGGGGSNRGVRTLGAAPVGYQLLTGS